jgi:hypothetical protein
MAPRAKTDLHQEIDTMSLTTAVIPTDDGHLVSLLQPTLTLCVQFTNFVLTSL